MYKVFIVCVLLAAASAAPADDHHQATSYASINSHHNSVHHIHSAPAPIAHHYSAPTIHQAPAVYAAPAITKVALPVVAKVAAPVVHSYHSAPAPIVHSSHYATHSAPIYAAPVAKVALPVITKQVITPVAKYVAAPKEEEHAPAHYEFAYGIQDPHTGDYHSQEEHRDGHTVVGQYSLHEADGTVRIVKYSDDGHGFNAIVEREGHPTEAPVAYKKVLAVAAPHYAQPHHY